MMSLDDALAEITEGIVDDATMPSAQICFPESYCISITK